MKLKPNIYIPIEVMYRELTQRVYLAGRLAKAGYRVYIGSKEGIYNLIKNKKIKEGIFFYKSAFGQNTKTTIPLVKKCDHAAVIDEELGIGMAYAPSQIEGRIINLKYISKLFVIGNEIKKEILKRAGTYKKIIVSSGWPYYDVLKTNYLKYYELEAKKIRRKHNKFYLFSSNFGYLNKKDLAVQLDRKWFKNSERNKRIINECYSNAYLDYKTFVRKINNYSATDKTKIIIRPHPNDHKFKNWIEDVNTSKNVKIVYDNDIIPWILASEGLIHRGCSTSGVANLLNKKTFYLLPDRKLNNYEKNITYKISQKIQDLNLDKYKKIKVNKKPRIKILNKNIKNFSKINSSEIIISNLNKLSIKKTEDIHRYSLLLGFKDQLIRVKIFFNNYFLRTSKLNLKKPKQILKNDIKKKLSLIFNDNNIKVKSLGGETFKVDC